MADNIVRSKQPTGRIPVALAEPRTLHNEQKTSGKIQLHSKQK
jgi:hypothetical protein